MCALNVFNLVFLCGYISFLSNYDSHYFYLTNLNMNHYISTPITTYEQSSVILAHKIDSFPKCPMHIWSELPKWTSGSRESAEKAV